MVNLLFQIREITGWKTFEINYKKYEVAYLLFTQFYGERNYRLVIMREKGNKNHIDAFTGDGLIYRSRLSNKKNFEKQVIECYNKKDAAEKTFDVMNNDFC